MAANHLAPAWTIEEDLRLAQLIQDGLTYSAIAALMGRTKNGCISRAHRALGAYTRDTKPLPVKKVKPPSPPKPAKPKAEKAVVLVQDNKPQPRYAPPEASTTAFGDPRRLLKLQAHHCRWPVSGEGAQTLFCCATREGFGPYCENHRLIAWRPTPRQDLARMTKAYR